MTKTEYYYHINKVRQLLWKVHDNEESSQDEKLAYQFAISLLNDELHSVFKSHDNMLKQLNFEQLEELENKEEN